MDLRSLQRPGPRGRDAGEVKATGHRGRSGARNHTPGEHDWKEGRGESAGRGRTPAASGHRSHELSRLGWPSRPALKAADVALSPGAFRPLCPPSPIALMEWSRIVPTDWRRLGPLEREEEKSSTRNPCILGPLSLRRGSWSDWAWGQEVTRPRGATRQRGSAILELPQEPAPTGAACSPNPGPHPRKP